MKRLFRWLRWVVGVGVVVALLLGGAAAFIGPKIMEAVADQRERNQGVEVDVETIASGTLVRTVSAPGAVTARTEVNISSRVSAEIISLPFEEGDEVREGDIIVELDRKELQARLDASKARLLADEANLQAAEATLISERASLLGVKANYDKEVADFERAQELHASGDISEADLHQARAELDSGKAQYDARVAAIEGVEANVEAARARVAVARADVDQAQENLEFTIIRAPIAGVVTVVNSKEGEIALGTISNQGSVIMKIADLTEMLVDARVAEVDVAMVAPGQRSTVYINGYPNEEFQGTVRKVALDNAIAGDGTSYFDAEVVLHLEEGRRIFAGLTANVDIDVEEIDGVVVVPSQAVVDRRVDDLPKSVRDESDAIDEGRSFTRAVFVREGDEARLRPVRIAASNLRRTAVIAGLTEGEEIIVGPFRSLKDLSHEKKIRLREDENAEDEGEVLAAEAEEEDAESVAATEGG